MNTSRRALPFALFTAGSLLAACGDTTVAPTPDAAVTPDVIVTPDVTVDAAPPDRLRPLPLPACPSEADLAGMTPGSDGAVRVTGSTVGSELTRFGAFPSACFSGGAVGRFVVYGYTMRADGALRVSTVNPGTTSAAFDTFVAVLGSCIPTAHSITCNDNAGDAAAGAVHARHSTATTGALVRGQRVYIVVGGRGSNPAMATSGAFELSARELALGADNGPCRLSGESCDAGLQCTVLSPTVDAQGICRRPVAQGMPCVGGDLCVRGSACIANPADTTRGTCIMDATRNGVCLVGRAPCGAGLSCTNPTPTPDATGVCRTTLMAGAECDPSQLTGVCAASTACRQAPVASNPGRYLCFAVGARGGLCRTASPRCEAGLECSAATTPTCRAIVASGAECDLTANATVCAAGSSCAPDAMFAGGTCVADGTAPGTACRGGSPQCDAGLECSAFGGRNVCQSTATAACDWRYGSVVCGAAATCLPAGVSRGVCAAPAAEAEPNNTPAAAQGPVTESAIFRGSITAGDVDCFQARVPAGGASLFVETNNNAGGCPAGGADTVVAVYNPAGARIVENDDIAQNNLCSRINGLVSGPLNNLAAGSYAVCVRSYNTTSSIASYHLTLAIVPSM
jgi:hypothetical protein